MAEQGLRDRQVALVVIKQQGRCEVAGEVDVKLSPDWDCPAFVDTLKL